MSSWQTSLEKKDLVVLKIFNTEPEKERERKRQRNITARECRRA